MENPSIISHVSIGTNDFEKAKAFYDAVFEPFGVTRIADYPMAVAYGKQFPEFWVHPPLDGGKAQSANGVHFSFMLNSKDEVDTFYELAIKHGATDDGAPGPRDLYGPGYYGGYVRDLDGHKIEPMFWDETKS